MPRWVLAMWFLPIWSLRVGWEQHVSESSNRTWTPVLWVYPDISKKQLSCNSQCLSHFIALFIVVGDETRNDSDNDTLIEDGSGMCWTSGPPGMSDHGPSKKSSEIWICVARCRLRKVSGNTVRRQRVEMCAVYRNREKRRMWQIQIHKLTSNLE